MTERVDTMSSIGALVERVRREGANASGGDDSTGGEETPASNTAAGAGAGAAAATATATATATAAAAAAAAAAVDAPVDAVAPVKRSHDGGNDAGLDVGRKRAAVSSASADAAEGVVVAGAEDATDVQKDGAPSEAGGGGYTAAAAETGASLYDDLAAYAGEDDPTLVVPQSAVAAAVASTVVLFPDHGDGATRKRATLLCASERLDADDFFKGAKWSPDGTCLLAAADDNKLRMFELPATTLGRLRREGPGGPAGVEEDSGPEGLSLAFAVSEGETIYDYCWYPGMSSAEPASCCFASSSRDHPVHMWDAFTGEVGVAPAAVCTRSTATTTTVIIVCHAHVGSKHV